MCLKITACRYVIPCSLVDSYECFEEIIASVFRVALIYIYLLDQIFVHVKWLYLSIALAFLRMQEPMKTH